MLDQDLKNLLEEMLSPLGPVVVKRMFGGGGIFLDGLMFGLIAGGTLYLRADENTRAIFEAEGMRPFAYQKKAGQTTIMSYWRAPERLLDEPDELVDWARQAFSAAERAKQSRRPKRSRPGTG
jgi:DNA transformation protein and related proteins